MIYKKNSESPTQKLFYQQFRWALLLYQAILDTIPDIVPFGDKSGDILVIGWGSTYGAIRTAVERARGEGKSVSHVHLRYINPLPKNLGDILLKYKKQIIPIKKQVKE